MMDGELKVSDNTNFCWDLANPFSVLGLSFSPSAKRGSCTRCPFQSLFYSHCWREIANEIIGQPELKSFLVGLEAGYKEGFKPSFPILGSRETCLFVSWVAHHFCSPHLPFPKCSDHTCSGHSEPLVVVSFLCFSFAFARIFPCFFYLEHLLIL